MRQVYLFFLLLPAMNMAADWESFPLRPNGTIPVWTVAGPLANKTSGAIHENCRGYFKDYLTSVGGERQVEPSEGDIIEFDDGRVSWKSAFSDTSGLLDYVDIFDVDEQTPAVAYAFCQLVSNKSQEVKLRIRSDDGVRVWLNTDLIHDHHIARGVDEGEDVVTASLKKGSNRLLVKVDQGNGGWGLLLRLLGPDDKSITGISSKVAISTPLVGKIISADFVASSVVAKTSDGPRQTITADIVSGGLKNVTCQITKDERPSPQTFHLGDLPVGKHRLELMTPVISETGTAQVVLRSSSDQKAFKILPKILK